MHQKLSVNKGYKSNQKKQKTQTWYSQMNIYQSPRDPEVKGLSFPLFNSSVQEVQMFSLEIICFKFFPSLDR